MEQAGAVLGASCLNAAWREGGNLGVYFSKMYVVDQTTQVHAS
jgi:hypothetical protein